MIELARLSLARFDAEFRSSFKHASAERARTENIIVIAEDAAGRRGYGEGCPRAYVTGETVETACRFVELVAADFVARVRDPASLKDWVANRQADIDANPSAFAAIELASVDLMARATGVAAEAALGLPAVDGVYRYSAVLGDSSDESFGKQLALYRAAGFTDFKLKLSGARARDLDRIAAIGAIGAAVRLRVDCNNLWDDPADCIAHLGESPHPIFAIEEPLRPAGRLRDLQEIATRLGTRIVLDESLSPDDLRRGLPGDPSLWLLNCRVSRLGGVIRGVETVSLAAAAGHGVIVGAHVGETSLLTRAALPLARAAGRRLVAQEGAFGLFLLGRDVTAKPLMFGAGGAMEFAPAMAALPGWGVAVDEKSLSPLA